MAVPWHRPRRRAACALRRWVVARLAVVAAAGALWGSRWVAAADLPFPMTASTPGGRAFSRQCSLQCEFSAAAAGNGSGQCLPRSGFPPLYAPDIQHALHAAVAEAGGGPLGGATVRVAVRPRFRPRPPLPGEPAVREPLPWCPEEDLVIPDELLVANGLALYRNSLAGSVAHSFGTQVLKVLGVSNLRLGICLDAACAAPVAVDTTRTAPVISADEDGGGGGGSGGGSAEAPFVGTPIITHVGVDGVARPVSMGHAGLLSLGRAPLESPTFFVTTPPSVLETELDATLTFKYGNPIAVSQADDHGPQGRWQWRLGGSASAGAPASESRPSFSWADFVSSVIGLNSQAYLLPQASWPWLDDWPLEQMTWTVDAGPVKVANRSNLTRPPWPAADEPPGLADDAPLPSVEGINAPREINPASTAEARLAAALPQRLALTRSPATMTAAGRTASAAAVGRRMLPRIQRDVAARISAQSYDYDASVWGTYRQPPPMVSVGDMILAAVVVLPEVGALVGLLLTAPVARSGRHFVVFHLVYWAGLLSLISVWALVKSEGMLASWKRVHESYVLSAVLPDGIDTVSNRSEGLAGSVLMLESSLLIARAGWHRLGTVRAVALALTLLYALVATPAVGWVSVRYGRRAWRRHRASLRRIWPGGRGRRPRADPDGTVELNGVGLAKASDDKPS